MGVFTWKREFMKGRLRDAARTQEDAINHSIVKWKGLTKDNLKKHNVAISSFKKEVIDADGACLSQRQSIDGTSCALCVYSQKQLDAHNRKHPRSREYNECKFCPIVKTGFHSCGRAGSPWKSWKLLNRGPNRMITLLEKVKAKIQAGIV